MSLPAKKERAAPLLARVDLYVDGRAAHRAVAPGSVAAAAHALGFLVVKQPDPAAALDIAIKALTQAARGFVREEAA